MLGIVRVCRKIAGTALNDLSELHKERSVTKARLILAYPVHPLHRVRVRPRVQVASFQTQIPASEM